MSLRALMTGVTGLRNFSNGLDVIGNNIANVGTTGYKGSRITYKEVFATTLRSATRSSNPLQVGLGTRLGSVDQNFKQGNLTSTGRSTDMAIEGNGFFVLQSLETGSTDYLYTRDGSFTLDSQNNLVDAFGHKVMGYGVIPDPVTGELVIDTTQLVPINIPIGVDSFAGPTRNILYNGNLDGNSAVATTYNTTSQIYDSLGNPHTMTMTFTKTAMGPPSTWDYAAQIDGNAATGTGTLAYDVDGQFDLGSSTINTINYTIAPPNGADDLSINPTFVDTTQLRGENTLAASDQDGYSLGTVNGFTIGNDGIIIASATNGQFREIGQVALATFSNPEGLLRTGSNLFIQTPNSGLNQIDVPLSGQRGSITAEYLEDSNVELSDEFTKMIVTQRAFQANSKVITTASDMLAEVNNLIR